MLRYPILLLGLISVIEAFGQRSYKNASVLSSGDWFKISVKEAGIYKVDAAMLQSLGATTGNMASASIRLYGNGGQMLPEESSGQTTDDLQENAIEIFDGGDGRFNGSDYFLFYAGGPDQWLKDSLNQRFQHQKNLYSDLSFYFITFSGTGKRISTHSPANSPAGMVTSYTERYVYELDSINFLASGKDWFGVEFSNTPGKMVNRSFNPGLSNLVAGAPATIVSKVISRSINTGSKFSVLVNNLPVLQHDLPGVTAGNLDLFARESRVSNRFFPAGEIASVTYQYNPGTPGAQGWMDWFEVFAERNLTLKGKHQLLFRDWKSVVSGASAQFSISAVTAATTIWDVTNSSTPIKMKTVLSGDELNFVNDCSTLHEYVAFDNTGFLLPAPIGKIPNQDLHRSSPADLIIVTHPDLAAPARRLASFHTRNDHLKVVVVSTAQVYNEFASGSPDPTAIRDFVKMYYDKAGRDSASRPKYLLLFGDASYDYKDRLRNNTNLVPAYQSPRSLDPLASFTSDDYFGFLDDNEDVNSVQHMNLLDIGIGRIPAKTTTEANDYLDKVIAYSAAASLGPWRNQVTLIADDEDYNLHVHDAEVVSATIAGTNPDFIENKIYLDAFRQQSISSGGRYPEVNKEIQDRVEAGTLIWNYSGHGGSRRLAEEVVLDREIVNSWNNEGKLPLFITATCDFAPYDNPANSSLGEYTLLKPKTGAIALMTTTRLVFAYSNRIMNRNYLLAALRRKPDGTYLSLGEAVRQAKNTTYQSFGDITNNRKFTLLGDPALTLAFPRYQVQTNAINDVAVAGRTDTLKAMNTYTVKGSVTDQQGNVIKDFNGLVYPVVYDKLQLENTLANDPESLKESFAVWKNILFRGKADVVNGNFQFTFVVPKDINYRLGNGKISYYAENGQTDGNGSFTSFMLGGSLGVSADVTGPEIKAVLNDENFVNGSVTNERPVLLLTLSDSSGINITGTGIGHDITAMLDGDPKNTFVLNKFFEAGLNNYRNGTVRFQLPELTEGNHTLKIKAWDAVNNSSEITVSLMVKKNLPFSILHVMNFPNPFTSKTTFRFQHDLDARNVSATINIFTVSGKLIKSIRKTINSGLNRSCDIEWDGKNDFGSDVLKGLYFYQVKVATAGGVHAERSGELIIR